MEKRRHKRFAKRITVRYGEASPAHSGITADLSLSGAFVCAQQLPPIGARVKLQFSVGTSGTISLEGIVQRHRLVPPQLRQIAKRGFGVSFVAPGGEVQRLLPQVSAEQRGRFVLTIGDSEQFRRVYEKHLQFGRMLVATEQQFQPDSGVTVVLDLDFSGQRLELAARVVQQLPEPAHGVAVEFEDKTALASALSALLPTAHAR